MSVGVDAPRNDQSARGVNGPGAPGDVQVEPDLLDDLVLDVDIRPLTAILIDHHPSFDEDPEKISELMKPIPSQVLPVVRVLEMRDGRHDGAVWY